MKNNHKPWTMRASADGTLEVMLYDEIGESYWSEGGTTAKQFDADLKAAGDVRRIHLRINSPGGDVWQGLAIFNTLRGHGAAITAQVDGIAASISSVILMAADVGGISMGETAMVMIHNPSTIIAGDENDMRKMADTLAKVKDSMVTAYLRHSSLSSTNLRAAMDEESWYSAEEALAAGLADEVTEEDDPEENDDEPADLAAALRTPIFARFKHAPPGLAARLARPRRPAASTSRTKRVDGENLTSECFISVGDEEDIGTWHLPWRFSTEEKTESHLRDALSRFDQTDIPESEKPRARAKLVRLCKEHGITVSDEKSGKALARMIAACDGMPEEERSRLRLRLELLKRLEG